MKTFTSPNQKIGRICEDIACAHLRRLGFSVSERNFTRKWGEIDIIAVKRDVLHFIEVKGVSCENIDQAGQEQFKPEDQVHGLKRGRLRRTIETYVSQKEVGEWSFDLVCVYFDGERRRAKVKILEGLII